MANRCAGLDPTWAHLPTPAPTHTAHAAAASHYNYWLTSAAAFENEALTSALRASMAPAHPYSASAAAAASSFSSPATPSSSTTSSASEFLSASSGHDAPAPVPESSRPGARALAGGPRGGRVTKRKPRPSRRPQTTYITADPANFRRMVQEITGLPGPSSSFPAAASEAAPNWTTPAPACVLPTLDTSAFLLDRAAAAVPAAPEEKSPAGGGRRARVVDRDGRRHRRGSSCGRGRRRLVGAARAGGTGVRGGGRVRLPDPGELGDDHLMMSGLQGLVLEPGRVVA